MPARRSSSWDPPLNISEIIRTKMKMLHIYQPVMIKELLAHGKTSIHNIAVAFLARDASQLEYYEQIKRASQVTAASPPRS